MPTWLDVKTVLAFFSLIVAAGVFLWNWLRTRKMLVYDYWSAPLMGSVKSSFSGRVELTLDGKIVRNVSQVSIRIKNSGSVSIERKDFDTPVSITVRDPAKILSATVVKATPPALAFNVPDPSGHNYLELPRLLLNPKDEFTIAALVSDFKEEEMGLSGRIVGVKSLARFKGESTFLDLWVSRAGIIIGVGCVAITGFIWADLPKTGLGYTFWSSISGEILGAAIIASIIRRLL